MPWRSPIDKLFQDSAQTQRRKKMLRDGPPYRGVAAAKRAFDQGQLNREAYEDVVWTLKVWRTNAVEEVAASRARGEISAEEQRRQLERIEKRYTGR